uniref:Uncharacterized protein n=1 Tax=Anguilla anguilla TaxID=7936 RepID=A0A0E9SIU0_ANGAN
MNCRLPEDENMGSFIPIWDTGPLNFYPSLVLK